MRQNVLPKTVYNDLTVNSEVDLLQTQRYILEMSWRVVKTTRHHTLGEKLYRFHEYVRLCSSVGFNWTLTLCGVWKRA
jgi:hypothetical protein